MSQQNLLSDTGECHAAGPGPSITNRAAVNPVIPTEQAHISQGGQEHNVQLEFLKNSAASINTYKDLSHLVLGELRNSSDKIGYFSSEYIFFLAAWFVLCWFKRIMLEILQEISGAYDNNTPVLVLVRLLISNYPRLTSLQCLANHVESVMAARKMQLSKEQLHEGAISYMFVGREFHKGTKHNIVCLGELLQTVLRENCSNNKPLSSEGTTFGKRYSYRVVINFFLRNISPSPREGISEPLLQVSQYFNQYSLTWIGPPANNHHPKQQSHKIMAQYNYSGISYRMAEAKLVERGVPGYYTIRETTNPNRVKRLAVVALVKKMENGEDAILTHQQILLMKDRQFALGEEDANDDILPIDEVRADSIPELLAKYSHLFQQFVKV